MDSRPPHTRAFLSFCDLCAFLRRHCQSSWPVRNSHIIVLLWTPPVLTLVSFILFTLLLRATCPHRLVPYFALSTQSQLWLCLKSSSQTLGLYQHRKTNGKSVRKVAYRPSVFLKSQIVMLILLIYPFICT